MDLYRKSDVWAIGMKNDLLGKIALLNRESAAIDSVLHQSYGIGYGEDRMNRLLEYMYEFDNPLRLIFVDEVPEKVGNDWMFCLSFIACVS